MAEEVIKTCRGCGHLVNSAKLVDHYSDYHRSVKVAVCDIRCKALRENIPLPMLDVIRECKKYKQRGKRR